MITKIETTAFPYLRLWMDYENFRLPSQKRMQGTIATSRLLFVYVHCTMYVHTSIEYLIKNKFEVKPTVDLRVATLLSSEPFFKNMYSLKN